MSPPCRNTARNQDLWQQDREWLLVQGLATACWPCPSGLPMGWLSLGSTCPSGWVEPRRSQQCLPASCLRETKYIEAGKGKQTYNMALR